MNSYVEKFLFCVCYAVVVLISLSRRPFYTNASTETELPHIQNVIYHALENEKRDKTQ